MRRFLWLVVLLVAIGGLASPAVAGGWAVTTLDSVPSPRAGEAVPVGFVIRQHGVSPVNPDGEVGLTVFSPLGDETFFPAKAEGEIGHHVTNVLFGESGTSTWTVHQGRFGRQDLGTIEVAPEGVAAAITETEYRWPGLVRLGLPAMALALGSGAVVDVALRRRRRHQVMA